MQTLIASVVTGVVVASAVHMFHRSNRDYGGEVAQQMYDKAFAEWSTRHSVLADQLYAAPRPSKQKQDEIRQEVAANHARFDQFKKELFKNQ